MNIQSQLGDVTGIGAAAVQKLAVLGVYSIWDLIHYYPRRYDDYSTLTPIANLKPGVVSVEAVIKQITGRYVRRGMHITEAVASDKTGSLRLIWFNQPYRANATKLQQTYFISGNFEMSRGRLSLMNPAMELTSEFPVNTARIVSIYRETKGFKSASIRKLIVKLMPYIQTIPENLPASVVLEHKLLPHSEAILAMHFPESVVQLDAARRRLGFEEIFSLSLASVLNKIEATRQKTHNIPFNEKLIQEFVGSLPFTLTDSQRRVAWQIFQDLNKDMPMNRMIEGDVGSGKTVVAAMAALVAIDHGFQVAFMAPTELLASQHADNLYKLLQPVDKHQQVALLTGSLKPKQKKVLHAAITEGKTNLIIGTHALITQKVSMHKLGLVIIDEQHRFGVEQRKKLQQKADGRMPHVISMTATPIPRTLALTLYGELDISVLHEKPSGRLPVITEIISPNSRKPLYGKIEQELSRGGQMFVVCPLISESDKLVALSAEKVYEEFSKKQFKHRRVGLLHGKMKAEEKDNIMAKFVTHELDILVSTTVIEVGVDVPNATIMLIEGAERFGLAQIHQLRGRVGRSAEQGYCYLIMSDSKEPTRRLRAVQNSNDGFKLSELDLEIRGPGAIYGQSQSGELDLRIAKLTDVKLIEAARTAANAFAVSDQKLSDYPSLQAQVSKYRSVTNLN